MSLQRREFITFLGSAAAWPLAARAQKSAMPVVGYLRTGAGSPKLLPAFRQGLASMGFVEGQNVTLDLRYADDRPDRLPALAAGLVRREVALIYAGDTTSSLAVKAATTTIPIVFRTGGDPVSLGLVPSLNRPGGNITGVSFLATSTAAIRLEMLHEAVPKATVIGVLVNPHNPTAEPEARDAEAAARKLGLELHVAKATNEGEIDTAFVALAERRASALSIVGDGFFTSRVLQLVLLSARHAIPSIYNVPDFPEAGGLMSYGASNADADRLGGVYVGRILKGDKPADLPVQQSVKVELIINMIAAKVLGVSFPLTLLGRADQVIE
jgi:putative ABC transport system substrate-binding protein